MCNGLKNKIYYIFDKGGIKKDGYVMGAKMRPCIAYGTTWRKNEISGAVAIDLLIYRHGKHSKLRNGS